MSKLIKYRYRGYNCCCI